MQSEKALRLKAESVLMNLAGKLQELSDDLIDACSKSMYSSIELLDVADGTIDFLTQELAPEYQGKLKAGYDACMATI